MLAVEITSVAGKKQQLNEAASAVFVITDKDIRRSGATSIPEVLRLAPGLQVARMDNNKWAISSRGFNGEFANKLLVLIDGRSVYTPTFSGVYWEDQNIIMEDIERIEVIRGPGATLWGANAVNGVINIITKPAVHTKGGVAQITTGNEETALVHLRYGTALNDDINGRAYLKYADRDNSHDPYLEDQANDNWQVRQGGFRLDSVDSGKVTWTVQGDVFANEFNQTTYRIWLDPNDPENNPPDPLNPYLAENVKDDVKSRGHNLLGRWEQAIHPESLLSLQVYYDHTERHEDALGQNINTYDVEIQHQYSRIDNHDVIWGLGYRRIDDRYTSSFYIAVDRPEAQTSELFSAFVQDEIALLNNNLRFTLGSKFEHNSYTGFEIQPGVKLLWLPEPGVSLWGSIARASRTPSAVESRGRLVFGVIPGDPLVVTANQADGSFESEDLMAFELGVRFQPAENVSFDLALFRNEYKNVNTFEFDGLTVIPNPEDPLGFPLIVPLGLRFDNKMQATSQGAELAVDWRINQDWAIQSSYSYLNIVTSKDKDSVDMFADRPIEGGAPNHYLTLRSAYNFAYNLAFDLWVYYVDELRSTSLSTARNDQIDAYTSVNLKLSWEPVSNVVLSLAGQNILDDRHQEFVGEYFSTEHERSVYGQIRLEF